MAAEILCLREFGSRARGDADELSDRDILAVVDAALAVDVGAVEAIVATLVGANADVSIYSYDHLRSLFADGHLFAWHLWRESKPLGGPRPYLLEELGRPAENRDARQEISDLAHLLSCVQPADDPRTLTYNAGILYVVVRNVATSATWFFGSDKIDFSRRSPWALMAFGGPPPPVDAESYDRLARARKAGTAGVEPPTITPDELAQWFPGVISWVSAVARFVDGLAPVVDEQAILDEL